MPARRSISVEPEDLAVASPRRSTRISISKTLHVDSPIPNAKKSDSAAEIKAAPRRRRSQSIQEKSLSEMQEDVKNVPARRSSRRLSSLADEPIAGSSKTEPEIAAVPKPPMRDKNPKNEAQQKEETDNSSNENEEVLDSRPRRRVTRSMSTSPVSTTTQKPKYSVLALQKRRLSISDKLPTETKPAALDIITENEDEVHEPSKEDKKEDISTADVETKSPPVVKKKEDTLNNNMINKSNSDTNLKETEVNNEIHNKSVEQGENNEIANSKLKEKVAKLEEIIDSVIQKVEETSDEPEVHEPSKEDKKEDISTADVETKSPPVVKKKEDTLNNNMINKSNSDTNLKETEVNNEIHNKSVKQEENNEISNSKLKEKVAKLEEIIDSVIQKVEETSDEPEVASTKIKKEEVDEKNSSTNSDVDTSIKVLEKSIHNSYLSESEKAEIDIVDKPISGVDTKVDDQTEISPSHSKIKPPIDTDSNISLIQENKETNEVAFLSKSHDSGESNIPIVDTAHNFVVSTPVQIERTLSTLTPLNNISNFELNSSKNKNVSSTPKTLDAENVTPTKDDKLEQNLSFVKDGGESYSPIVNVKNISFNMEEEVNVSDSAEEETENKEKSKGLNISTRSQSSKINDDCADNTKNLSNINTSKKEMFDTSARSQDLQNTRKLEKSAHDDSSDINTSKKECISTPRTSLSVSSSAKKSSSKRKESLAKIREQLLEQYIESFTSQKRKRDSNETLLDDSSAHIEKKSRKNVKELDFSEDESNDEEKEKIVGSKNEFLDDEAFEGSEDTPSVDSNEIIFEGQSLGSSSERDSDSADTYEDDSFVVDDENFDLLSGEENFLESPPLQKKKKNRRIIQDSASSGSEADPNLDKMSMEGYGGLSPSITSEKQISSIDSDLESVQNRNEILSRQIENGTFKHEEKKIVSEKGDSSDEDIIVVETKNYSEEDSFASEPEIETPAAIINKSHDAVDSERDNEELCLKVDETKECIESPEDKEPNEQKEKPVRVDSKHKEILQMFFDNLNSSHVKRKRRETIDFTSPSKIDKSTQTSQKRKRSESFELEITDIMKEEALKKFEKYRQASQQNAIASDRKRSPYEVNSSGVYRVSPMRETLNKYLVEPNEEELEMLKDFNNSLNENLEEVAQIVEGKISKKQKRIHNKMNAERKEKMFEESFELGETFFANEEQEIAEKTAKLEESVCLTNTYVMDADLEDSLERESPKKRWTVSLRKCFVESQKMEILDQKETEVKTTPKKKQSLNVSDFEKTKHDEPMANIEEESKLNVPEGTEVQGSPKKNNKKRKSLNIYAFEETENDEPIFIKEEGTKLNVSGKTEVKGSPKKKNKKRKSLNISAFEETENDEPIINKEEETKLNVPEEIEVKGSSKKKNKKRKSLNISVFEEAENDEPIVNKEGETKLNVPEEFELKGSPKKKNKKRKSLNINAFEETVNEEERNIQEVDETILEVCKESEIKTSPKNSKSLNISVFEENEEHMDSKEIEVDVKIGDKNINNKRRKSLDLSCFEETKNEERLEVSIVDAPKESELQTIPKKKNKKRKSLSISGIETENKELVDKKEEIVLEVKASPKNKRKSLSLCEYDQTENEEFYKKKTVADVPKEIETKSNPKKKKNKKGKLLNTKVEQEESTEPPKIFETVEFVVDEVNSSISPKLTKAEKKKIKKQKKRLEITGCISDSEIPILVPIEEINTEPRKNLKERIKESLEEQIALVSSNIILEATSSNSYYDEDSKYNIGKKKNVLKKTKLDSSSDSSENYSPNENLPKFYKKRQQGFEVKKEKSAVSKSENYLPVKKPQQPVNPHNHYKKLIRPSSFGSTGSSFTIEDLTTSLPKLNHNKIKKNKKHSSLKDKLSINLKNTHLKEEMLKSTLVKSVNLLNKC